MTNPQSKQSLDEQIQSILLAMYNGVHGNTDIKHGYPPITIAKARTQIKALLKDYSQQVQERVMGLIPETIEVRGTTQNPDNPAYWTKRTQIYQELRIEQADALNQLNKEWHKMSKIFPEMDMHYIKSEVTYRLWKNDGVNKKDAEIFVTVHLDNDNRKVSIKGTHGNFEFTKSDPHLAQNITELMQQGIELAQNELRVKHPKEDKPDDK